LPIESNRGVGKQARAEAFFTVSIFLKQTTSILLALHTCLSPRFKFLCVTCALTLLAAEACAAAFQSAVCGKLTKFQCK